MIIIIIFNLFSFTWDFVAFRTNRADGPDPDRSPSFGNCCSSQYRSPKNLKLKISKVSHIGESDFNSSKTNLFKDIDPFRA